MIKKNKIIDVIFYGGEINILNFRINELKDIVDYFIIVNDKELNELIHQSIDNKITYIFSNITSESFFIDIQKKLKNKLINMELNFEDIIIFSECDEIPDFDYYELFLTNINYSPFYINHTIFHWDKHYFSNKKRLGSLVSNFSYLVQSLTNVETYFINKNTPLFGDPDAIDCGWKFVNLFCEKNEENKIFIDEMIECCDDDPIKSKPLIQLTGEEKLPKNFDLLPNKFKKRTTQKKHLIVLDSENKNHSDDYDSFHIINFNNIFPEKFIEKNNNNELLSTLFLPDKVFYGEKKYEEYIEDYKLNDIKRIIHTTFPQDQDIFYLRFKEHEFIFKWSDWKDRNLCELKNPSV